MLDPAEAQEARRAICRFEDGLGGTDPVEVDRMVTKLAALYPSARVSEEEADARRRLYVELLADLPRDVLSAAFKRCGQTCKFFPSVAEIREAAQAALTERRWRLFSLKRLVAKHDREWEPPIPEDELCKPEDAARILREVAEEMSVTKASADKENRRERTKRDAGE